MQQNSSALADCLVNSVYQPPKASKKFRMNRDSNWAVPTVCSSQAAKELLRKSFLSKLAIQTVRNDSDGPTGLISLNQSASN